MRKRLKMLKVNLPSELVHFFNFTCKYKPGVPLYFWRDHPYFWFIRQRVNFAYKLNKISKRDRWEPHFVPQLKIVTNRSYKDWWKRLTGLYHELWKKREKGKDEEVEEFMTQALSRWYKVKPYKEEYDVIRFVGTFYNHVNDPEYQRSNDEECDGRELRDSLADTDIEADLGHFFPDYYMVMFEIVCCCFYSRSINVGCLKEISSFSFNSNVFWRTSRKQHILGLGIRGV
ncbi:hypothetical protein DM860_017169 [Cuscuta australis]|uniref:Uncharacterized protein n=1 Tax=Cuscuta australis TaxID=267555 RepID=A0A328DXQ1_9ASTE|nr:hypothetical protein DM860_017169 [Cuscuta australis]